VDTYRNEFLKNANLTFYRNELGTKNLFLIGSSDLLHEKKADNLGLSLIGFNNVFDAQKSSTSFNTNLVTQSNLLVLNTQTLLETSLKEDKLNLLKSDKPQRFKKPFLFVGGSEDSFLKEKIFKKTQLRTGKNKKPKLTKLGFSSIKTWDYSEVESFNTFFQKEVFGTNNKLKTTVQHPDLDDETRILKRNSGKNTPIRVLKCPSNDFFFKPSADNITDIELLRFRFNEQNPTLAGKPIKPTVYLTFKQKRYNQRNNIGKKTQMFFDKDLKKQQSYSGNPFLKNMSIIEENFGNPTRQYRLVKKAKSRLDTTRVAS
jgi:hypothetical protein